MAEYDWRALERSSGVPGLVRRQGRFVIPATIGFLAWYVGFVLLCGYAEDFKGSEFLVDGLTVGYVLALSQFVMVWGLTWLYLRKADSEFDPLEERVRELAAHPATEAEPRFDRATEQPARGPTSPAAPTTEG